MARESPERPEVLAQWSRLPMGTDSATVSDATRARVVDAIARTMLASAVRRSTRRTLYLRGLAAVAAAAIVLIGSALLGSRLRSEPVVARLYALFGAAHASVRGREIAAPSASSAVALGLDAQVATDRASSSRLQLVSGVEIIVGAETRLALPDTKHAGQFREELVLDVGLIDVRVPKLPKGHSFGVRTPNAVVSVHGTAFSVEVTKSGPAEAARTRVVVTEGVVSVQHGDREVLLDAGTAWTSSVAYPAAAGSESPRAGGKTLPETPSRLGTPRVVGQEPARESSAPLDAGTSPRVQDSPTDLANQNGLFSAAMNARDRGDRLRAVALLDELCDRYPSSPLTQDAYVARFRLLAQAGDRAAAARAARSYLAQYGNGFAAAEARATTAIAAAPLAFGSDGGR